MLYPCAVGARRFQQFWSQYVGQLVAEARTAGLLLLAGRQDQPHFDRQRGQGQCKEVANLESVGDPLNTRRAVEKRPRFA